MQPGLTRTLLALVVLLTGACRQTAYYRVENRSREPVEYLNYGFRSGSTGTETIAPGTSAEVACGDSTVIGPVLPIVGCIGYRYATAGELSLYRGPYKYPLPEEERAAATKWMTSDFYTQSATRHLGTMIIADKPGECWFVTRDGRRQPVKRVKL